MLVYSVAVFNLLLFFLQAYGSSLSDTRAQPGNSGRGVPTQANLTQGNNYYQQPGPNIRPQQSHTVSGHGNVWVIEELGLFEYLLL